MKRHNPSHQAAHLGMTTTSSVDSSILLNTSSLPAGRLIALIPSDSDCCGVLIQRIWQLATVTSTRVYLLGLCKDMTQELSLRRRLIAMSALLQDGGVFGEVKIEFGTNWKDAVRRNYQAGDIIVCCAEQRNGVLHKVFSQLLEENLDAPVLVLSDLYPSHRSRLNLLSGISLWAGFICIITGAFILQIRIMSLPREWAPTSLLIITVMAEFWLIWVWNKLFS